MALNNEQPFWDDTRASCIIVLFPFSRTTMKIGMKRRRTATNTLHKTHSSSLPACCQLNPTLAETDANMARADGLLER